MIRFALPLLLVIASCNNMPAPPPDSHHQPAELLLSDGTSLDGWKMCGPGEFVIDGGLKATGGMGMVWYADKSFKDFELTLEWQVEDAANNSGVFVRFPNPGDDPWVAVHQGYEIQVCDTAPEKHNTGSVYSFQAGTHIPTKPVGEWNEYIIRVVGQHYTIYINSEKVNEFDGDRSTEAYIGMQNHDDASPVRYRNIKVREL